MKEKILILNTKTYINTLQKYLSLVNKLKLIPSKKVKIWLAINPYFYLPIIENIPKQNKYLTFGLQNISFISKDNKPQTGEVVVDFEKINKAQFILLGHSERYRLGENLKIIKHKIDSLQNIKNNLVIFFSENSYKQQKDFKYIKKNVADNLNFLIKDIAPHNYHKIYLVYEPWWAISTEGHNKAEKNFLQSFLEWYQQNYSFPILYGGSYNSQLAIEYKHLNFSGYVVGKASTKIQEIRKIISILSH